MAKATMKEGYSTSDLRGNRRLSRCKRCHGDIFLLKLPGVEQAWWHEDAELDAHHEAVPSKIRNEGV